MAEREAEPIHTNTGHVIEPADKVGGGMRKGAAKRVPLSQPEGKALAEEANTQELINRNPAKERIDKLAAHPGTRGRFEASKGVNECIRVDKTYGGLFQPRNIYSQHISGKHT
eukprot:GILK01012553.1.p1 GENE.GILK01012553.1~~GILK01012553.1.p1  ORF type:complete len:113 (-),score=14.29 GILK01012553.1:46-384(-)